MSNHRLFCTKLAHFNCFSVTKWPRQGLTCPPQHSQVIISCYGNIFYQNIKLSYHALRRQKEQSEGHLVVKSLVILALLLIVAFIPASGCLWRICAIPSNRLLRKSGWKFYVLDTASTIGFRSFLILFVISVCIKLPPR